MPNYARRLRQYSDSDLLTAVNSQVLWLRYLEEPSIDIGSRQVREFKRQAVRDLRALKNEIQKRNKERIDKRPPRE